MSNSIVIIDYKMGNLRSVQKAFKKAGADVVISNDQETIRNASKLILPGVGAFKDGMKHLKELNLLELLHQKVIQEKTPILGICLGMQLLSNKSYENGETPGLGWIDAEVVKFDFTNQQLKIPHVGWNELYLNTNSVLFNGINTNEDFYFVHSYYFKPNENVTIATTEYEFKYTSAVVKDNIYGVQFHPEKSQSIGLKLIENFINL